MSPWQNVVWDGLETYRGEVSDRISVCVCVFFWGGISLHRFILEMCSKMFCCHLLRWIPSGCLCDFEIECELGRYVGVNELKSRFGDSICFIVGSRSDGNLQ